MNNASTQDPNFILNECREMDKAVDENEGQLNMLTQMRQQFLSFTNNEEIQRVQRQIDERSASVMSNFSKLVQRSKRIRAMPESGEPRNAPQVGRIDRRIKTSLNHAQQLDRDFRNKTQENFSRQYRTVRPDASDAEVQEALQTEGGAFQQGLMNATRLGQANTTVRDVRLRHTAIQKIEQDMMELAQLFQDMEALVVQQEPAVNQIEQKGEEVNDHVTKANVELDGAVKKARAARRKKWICLGIVGECGPIDELNIQANVHSADHYHHRGCGCCCGRGELSPTCSSPNISSY